MAAESELYLSIKRRKKYHKTVHHLFTNYAHIGLFPFSLVHITGPTKPLALYHCFELTIGSCFSVHYRVMEHVGSLESTKEA